MQEQKAKRSLRVINYAQSYDDVWGSGGIAPPLQTSAIDRDEWSASRPGRFTPGIKPTVPIVYKTGWGPEPVLTLWKIDLFP
jgi:hypothetical protein